MQSPPALDSMTAPRSAPPPKKKYIKQRGPQIAKLSHNVIKDAQDKINVPKSLELHHDRAFYMLGGEIHHPAHLKRPSFQSQAPVCICSSRYWLSWSAWQELCAVHGDDNETVFVGLRPLLHLRAK